MPAGVPVKIDVAGQQRDDRRELGDQVRHREDHRPGAALLDALAVDEAAQLQVVGVEAGRAELVDADERRTHRREPGVGLAHPELRRRGGELGDAVGDVLADGQPGDVVPPLRRRDVVATRADDRDELDLPVDVAGREPDVALRAGEARRVLGEHQRRRRQLHARLGGVVAVVQTDREDLRRPRGDRAERARTEGDGGGEVRRRGPVPELGPPVVDGLRVGGEAAVAGPLHVEPTQAPRRLGVGLHQGQPARVIGDAHVCPSFSRGSRRVPSRRRSGRAAPGRRPPTRWPG